MLNDVVIAGKTYAKMNVPETEALDEIAIKVIRQDAPDFLLPIKMLNIDGETEIRFEISEGMRLNYLPDSMLKKDFIILLENMIRPFKTCSDWFLDYHYFYLDKNYIIVGKDYADVKYAYIPTEQYAQSEEDVLNFFRDFILNINLNDDPTYVMNLYRHIKDKNATLVSILDYITQDRAKNAPIVESIQPAVNEDRKAIVNPINAPIRHEEFDNNKSVVKVQAESVRSDHDMKGKEAKSEFGKEDVKGNLINNLFGEVDEEPQKKEKANKKEKVKNASKGMTKEKNSKGIFGGVFGGNKGNAGKESNTPVSQPEISARKVEYAQPVTPVEPMPYFVESDATFIGEIEEVVNDGTKFVLELEEDKGYHFPKYIEIDLGKGYATVGRFDKAGNPQSDYNFDATLSFISRRHFRIERKGNQFQIIDLGSANGTLLNNEVLVANMPYIVQSGDRIMLSKNNRITYRVR